MELRLHLHHVVRTEGEARSEVYCGRTDRCRQPGRSAERLSEGAMWCCLSCTTCAPFDRTLVAAVLLAAASPFTPLIICCDFPGACVQISSRLRNGADASRGSPVVDSILVCQWSWCVRLDRSAVSGGTATLVQALQACSGLHIACMSIIEGTWKSAGG